MVEHYSKEVIDFSKPHFKSHLKNPWLIVSVVLLVVSLGLAYSGGFLSLAGKSTVGTNAVNFINTQLLNGQGSVTLKSVSEQSGVYVVSVDYQGKTVPSYFTKDGKYFLGTQLIPMTPSAVAPSTAGNAANSPPASVPKSDKPKVELFVMSYCPFGTQAEKGILPVLSLLGNKIDGKIRFVHYTMHGEKEDTENFRQICIREEQESKFNSYLQCILNSTSQSAPADVNACMTKLGIDSVKVSSCMTGKAKDYYAADSALSKGYGVQGSPTLIINGVEAQSARSPSALLKTICGAFNNAPSECNTQLPSDNPSAGFGYSSSGADSAAAQCG